MINIGVGRFRILGVGARAPNSQQAHDVVTTLRRIDVFRRHMPTRFLIYQCQIITFLILKSDIIENSGIEFRGIVFQHLQIKLGVVGWCEGAG